MEKKASFNATVILIVRHLQTHYATNHLYWGFTVQVARSSKLLNFSMYLNSIDYRQCKIQFALRVFQTIQDILKNLQIDDGRGLN
jgi:predicted SPOUT superfamily RNA methylase MTH1